MPRKARDEGRERGGHERQRRTRTPSHDWNLRNLRHKNVQDSREKAVRDFPPGKSLQKSLIEGSFYYLQFLHVDDIIITWIAGEKPYMSECRAVLTHQ